MGETKTPQPVAAQQTPAKIWYKSSTIWLNGCGIVVILLQLGVNQQFIPLQYQELALALLNLLNRFRTSQPLALQ